METRSYRVLQALLLAALGFFFLIKVYDGSVLLYINRRFVFLVLLAAVLLLAAAQAIMYGRKSREETLEDHPHADLSAHDHAEQDVENHTHAGHDHGSYRKRNLAWLLIPLLLGVLVPARPLGSVAAASRGITVDGIASRNGGAGAVIAAIPAEQRSVLDWLRLFEDKELLAGLDGQPVDVSGFVFHDLRLQEDRFLVGRFTITCCVADAMAIGMEVVWPEAVAAVDNSWVRVTGKISLEERAGEQVPVILAENVQVVPEPQQPYLYQ